MITKKYVNQKILSIGILTVAFLIFLVINVFTANYLKPLHFDLTQNKMYTLSEGTKQIIAEIDEPITFEFYFSKKLAKQNPFLRSFGKRIEDLLMQYVKNSNGKIILRAKEPLPFTELEDEAVSRGLRGVPIDDDGSELFLGIIASNSVADEQIMPLVRPEREANLEYDLSRMLYSLSQKKLPTIGILSTLPIEGENELRVISAHNKPRANPWMILDQIQQSFDLEMLSNDLEVIPENIDTLMLVNPISLSKTTLQAIDNFAINGGHILAFVDPYVDTANANVRKNHTQYKHQEELAKLLAAWGITIDPSVVASINDAKSVRWKLDNHEQAVRYALWMDLDKKNFAKDDILTNDLERITIATPGAIKVIEGSSTNVTALITTSDDAMLVNADDVGKYYKDPRELLINYQSMGKYTLAARISGAIHSPYTQKIAENANIIVIADADLLHDHFWINIQNMYGEKVAVPIAANGNLVTSALENLSGSNALISIRNRALLAKPFTKIKQLTKVAEQEFKEKEAVLVRKLEETKQQLEIYDNQLQDSNVSNAIERKQTRDAFKLEFLNIRKQLRDVRHRLTQSIENLELQVKFFSIALMPMIVTILGIAMWLLQSFKYRRLH
jgi:ABC-type uncharacterized transport system involved in gliding motility auxiliary subunit